MYRVSQMKNKCVLILSQHFFGKLYTMLAREFHDFLFEEVYLNYYLTSSYEYWKYSLEKY